MGNDEAGDGKIRKTVPMPAGLVRLAEEKIGTEANPLNWARYLLHLVVQDLAKKGGGN